MENPAAILDHDPAGDVAMDRRFALVCKALGHPARIVIMRHLLQADTCICGQLVDLLPLAQSTVSQHLKILKEAGLIQGIIDGPRTCYCVDKKVLEQFKTMVQTL